MVDVPWTIDFSIINGIPYVASETTPDTLYLPHHRVVRDAVIAFNDIAEPGTSIYHEPLVEPKVPDFALLEP